MTITNLKKKSENISLGGFSEYLKYPKAPLQIYLISLFLENSLKGIANYVS
jgi:hypothetical protein